MHGTGYGNGIQIFGAYILQIGILHCGSIDGYNRILGIAAAAVGQRKISIVIEGAAVAVAVAIAMYSGQFQLVLTLLLLVYLSETFQIRRRQQQ